MPQITPHDDAVAHRHPQLIVTDAFLNTPIKFTTINLDAETQAREALAAYNVITRDGAEFAEVDLGASTPQIYSVEMYTPVYNRTNFRLVFKQFLEELNA